MYFSMFNYYIFNGIYMIVLVFLVCFKCLVNAEHKLVCVSVSKNMYKWINGTDLSTTPPNPMLNLNVLLQE